MNTEQVNELITSLESAGELSIKERKYLELAKAYQQMAAENLAQKNRTQQLIDIINNTDNAYCMCGDAMENHTYGGCGHHTGMFDYHYGKWLEHGNETPATDAYLAGIKADGVEEFAAHLRANDNGASVCKMIALGADDFAKQLREGAK
jgi:hypothetical protein